MILFDLASYFFDLNSFLILKQAKSFIKNVHYC